MFQYETIVDLTDLNDVSFRCKNEDCGRTVTIFNIESLPISFAPRCGRCSQEIAGATDFIQAFRELRKIALKYPGIRLRTEAQPGRGEVKEQK